MTRGKIHILADNKNCRDRIIKVLKQGGTSYHTYASKSSGPRFRQYVIKGLDPEIPLTHVIEAFEGLQTFDVRRMSRTDAEGRRTPISPIVLTVTPSTTIDEVKAVRHVDRCLFTVSAYIKRRDKAPPQCFRCQKFGHTKNYCGHRAACVRCGENHDITQCPRTTGPKCSNCGGQHVASYRQCPERQKIIKLAEERRRPKGQPPTTSRTRETVAPQQTKNDPRRSQEEQPIGSQPAIRPPATDQEDPQPIDTVERLTNMVTEMTKSVNAMMKRIKDLVALTVYNMEKPKCSCN